MDNVIESFEFYDYRPAVSENIDASGAEFSIVAFNEDIVTDPSKSLLVINGEVTIKHDVTSGSVTNTVELSEIDLNEVNFVNNGILHLFDRIDYYIGDTKIDSIRKPGISVLMKGLVSFETDLQYNNAGWRIASNNKSQNNVLNKSRKFSVTIPLSIVMGFFEDNKSYLYRMPQKLIFYRITGTPYNTVVINNANYKTPNVILKEITWRVPQVKFAIDYETKIIKEIKDNTDYDMYYRQWFYQSMVAVPSTEYTWDFPVAYAKTKYILLAFQNDSNNDFRKDNSTFDFMNLENVQVLLNNNVYYPRERLNLKLSELKCGNLYHMFKQFKASYYAKNPEDVQPLVDYDTFLTKYPIIAIDCSHQPFVIKESLINIKISFNWRDPVSSSLIIHCVMISDRKVRYNPLNNRVYGP